MSKQMARKRNASDKIAKSFIVPTTVDKSQRYI